MAAQKQTPGWSPANAPTREQEEAIMGGAGTGDKSFANLQAEFALKGHQLHRTAGPKPQLFAARWGLVRQLANLDEARQFLGAIGGGK